MTAPDPRGDRGSATVLAAGIIAVLLTVTLAALVVLGALRSLHVARASADLAALAGAGHLQEQGDPGAACREAERIAARQRATVTTCEVGAGEVVTVTTSVGIPLRPPGVPESAEGRARAGPVPTGGDEGG